MADTVVGTLDQPLEEAKASVRSAAAREGYSIAEAESYATKLVFHKGTSGFSWGSHISVDLEETSPSQTRLEVTTGDTMALTDWGRGGRAARKLLDAVGAQH